MDLQAFSLGAGRARITTRCTARRSAASYAREVVSMIVNKVCAVVGRWAGGERERSATGVHR